ncbi:MAG: hypothetical protein R2911_19215 [Caldilineaceae bacterium]
MAAYALLNAFSGFEFDMVNGMIGFSPIAVDDNDAFRCFWSLDSGWGEFVQTADGCELRVLSGELELRELRLGCLVDQGVATGRCWGCSVIYARCPGTTFLNASAIDAGPEPTHAILLISSH